MASQRDRDRQEYDYADGREAAQKEASGFTPTTIRMPPDMQLFRFDKEGSWRIDIVPYVAGKGNPGAAEGKLFYKRTYMAHTRIGASNDSHVCLQEFGQKCPVCDYRANLQKGGDANPETIDALKPKKRDLWLVEDRKNRDAGIQLFETNYWFGLGEVLNDKILSDEDESRGYASFFRLDDKGKTLDVYIKKGSHEGRTNFKVKSIDFLNRDELDVDPRKMPCLDEILIELSYKKLEDILLQRRDEPKDDRDSRRDDDRRSSRRDDDPKDSERRSDDSRSRSDERDDRSSRRDDKDEDRPSRGSRDEPKKAEDSGIKVGDKVLYKKAEYEVIHISRDGTSLRLQGKDDEIERGIGVDEVKPIRGAERDDRDNRRDDDRGSRRDAPLLDLVLGDHVSFEKEGKSVTGILMSSDSTRRTGKVRVYNESKDTNVDLEDLKFVKKGGDDPKDDDRRSSRRDDDKDDDRRDRRRDDDDPPRGGSSSSRSGTGRRSRDDDWDKNDDRRRGNDDDDRRDNRR